MKSFLALVVGLALALPLWADQLPIDPNRAFTLTSVSHPGYTMVEAHSICTVALPGSTAPLRLRIVQGLANPDCVSLESAQDPGYFLRHQNSCVKLHPWPENDGLFNSDATFYLVHNPDGSVSFRSYNYPKSYIYVTAGKELYVATDPEVPTRSFVVGY